MTSDIASSKKTTWDTINNKSPQFRFLDAREGEQKRKVSIIRTHELNKSLTNVTKTGRGPPVEKPWC